MHAIEADAHLVQQLDKAGTAVDAILPRVEKLGKLTMDAAHIAMPQHLEGKTLAPPKVPAFLALLEDALGSLLSSAAAIVKAREPPRPETEEEQKALLNAPSEEVSPALATLRAATSQRTLASGKDAAKMLHNDSSERLVQMG